MVRLEDSEAPFGGNREEEIIASGELLRWNSARRNMETSVAEACYHGLLNRFGTNVCLRR